MFFSQFFMKNMITSPKFEYFEADPWPNGQKNNEICILGSAEEQKQTNPEFSGKGFKRHNWAENKNLPHCVAGEYVALLFFTSMGHFWFKLPNLTTLMDYQIWQCS